MRQKESAKDFIGQLFSQPYFTAIYHVLKHE